MGQYANTAEELLHLWVASEQADEEERARLRQEAKAITERLIECIHAHEAGEAEWDEEDGRALARVLELQILELEAAPASRRDAGFPSADGRSLNEQIG